MLTALLLVYLADVFFSLKIIIYMGSSIAAVILLVCAGICWEQAENPWPLLKKYIYVLLACIILSAGLPSKTLMYAAAGLVVGKQIIQTEAAQKAYTLINNKLDEFLAEQQQQQKERE